MSKAGNGRPATYAGLSREMSTLRWLVCALVAVSLVYLVLVSVSQRVEAGWGDVPVLVALAALSLPYRIRRGRRELANWVVALLSSAAASALAFPPYASNPSLAFFEQMLTAVFFAGMLLLPAAVGARALLPFIAVVVIVMTLVPETNGDLISRDNPGVCRYGAERADSVPLGEGRFSLAIIEQTPSC